MISGTFAEESEFGEGGFRVADAHDLFRQTFVATGDRIAALKAVRVRFGLDLRQAKEVMLQAEGTAASVDEHEERIAVALEQAITEQRHAAPIVTVVGGPKAGLRH